MPARQSTRIITHLLALSLLSMVPRLATAGEPRIIREPIEWCDTWIPGTTISNVPRVLLVGDSIVKGYYPVVEQQLKGAAQCARFTTSSAVADPAFRLQLEAALMGYRYSVIHFNNGLHGIGYTETEYRNGYDEALKTIRRLQPQARIIITLSTSRLGNVAMNRQVDARNEIVRVLAGQYDAGIDDLYAISKGHPEFYADGVHYKPVAIQLQGIQVANCIRTALGKSQTATRKTP